MVLKSKNMNKLGLKPCPFCARSPKITSWGGDTLYSINCECGAESPKDSKSIEGAKRIWNRRRFINPKP